jgi:hypothetical protein
MLMDIIIFWRSAGFASHFSQNEFVDGRDLDGINKIIRIKIQLISPWSTSSGKDDFQGRINQVTFNQRLSGTSFLIGNFLI